MKVSDLYEDGPLRGKDVYIIGAGPSMRAFPSQYFAGRTCVLLNDTWKYVDAGPVAFSNNKVFLKDKNRGNCPLQYQVVKARLKSDPRPDSDDNHVPWGHKDLYCFSYRERPWDNASHFEDRSLWREPCHFWNYRGGNVAIFAVQFAVLSGALAVHLVGCDCCNLGDMEYVDKKAWLVRRKMTKSRRVMRTGKLRHNYGAYVTGMLKLKERCMQDYGVAVVSVHPFMGLVKFESQFKQLVRKMS